MCGIIGIFGTKSVAEELYNGLIHLQHRGQDAAGMCTYSHRFHLCKDSGLVRDIFSQRNMDLLIGDWGIGHTRYSTVGSRYSSEDAQPFVVHSPYGIAMAHNGDLTNYNELKSELAECDKRHCNSGSDVEVILSVFASEIEKVAHSNDDIFEQICTGVESVFKRCIGGYSVVGIIAGHGMFAFRDPHGIRPFVWGRRTNENNLDEYVLASENTMFYPLGFEYAGTIKPGEAVFIDQKGVMHRKIIAHTSFTPCVFEYVYLARPDSFINNISVYRARLRMGQNLARRWKKEYPDVIPDIVIPVPFSSNTAGLSMAHGLKVRYSEGLYKNPFIGRTFIMPGQAVRKKSILQKLSPQEIEIKNKKVMLVDDSIVRGNTSRQVVELVRHAGAREVYFVSACPPVKYPDFYGIDIPTRNELIGAKMDTEQIRQYIKADILMYQNIADLEEAVTRKGDHGVDRLSMPYLDGWYVTGDVDEKKIQQLEAIKSIKECS